MDVQQTTINAVRILSAEAIQKAKSGHPGLPMGSAPIAYTLFQNFLKFNPRDAKWNDRDRFVLSAGHGSMLDYSLLYLYGYDVTKEDLKNFRQLGSKTPGHPEYGHTAGIETTTGPLGQGIANAVGMAAAEAHLAAKFNKPGFPVVDHYTYALCGDVMMVDAVAAEECEVLFVNISAFSDGAPDTVHEKLLRNLLTVSMRKNLSLSQRIFCTTPKTVRGRLLTYFSAQAARSGSLQFEIPFNRQQLADYLNLDRSALSKELCRMRDEGLLQFEKNHFVLNQLPE